MILTITPFLGAVLTSIDVKGKLNYVVTINVIDVSSKDTIAFFPDNVINNSAGLQFNFTTNQNIVDVIAIARVNGKIVKTKELNSVYTQTPILVDLDYEPPKPKPVVKNVTPTAPPPAPVVNTTNALDSQTVKTPETTKNSSKSFFNFSITGFSVIKNTISKINSKINWKTILYSLIGVIVLISAIFGTLLFIKKRGNHWSIAPASNIVPASKILINPNSEKLSYAEERRLRDAENKIKEAQSEIERLKNRERNIKEAERKLEQDRYELERLKRRY